MPDSLTPLDPSYLDYLLKALASLENEKPNDWSKKDRRFVVAKTELEKLIAYCEYYLK